MIYVYGDSHVSIFAGKDETLPERVWTENRIFKIYRAGAFTAYNLINKDLQKEIKENIPTDSELILSFGEIDCRLHLPKFKNTEGAVERYFQFIDSLMPFYKITLLLPPGSSKTEEKVEGSMWERNLITYEFNRLCKNKCRIRGLGWISLLDKTTDENLNTDMDYYYDTCHVKSIYLKDLICQYGRTY